MACILVHQGEAGEVRIGDAVFSWRAGAQYPLHVGIAVESRLVERNGVLRVRGLPDGPKGDYLGTATWGEPKQYVVSVLGQRLAVDPLVVKEVALLAEAVETEHSQVGDACEWSSDCYIDGSRAIRDGLPLFVRGTCSDFVEYLYEQVGLDLVNQALTCDPNRPSRLAPASQVHAFWVGSYPLHVDWVSNLGSYPECLFGERSTDR